jgi:hypothetical protein
LRYRSEHTASDALIQVRLEAGSHRSPDEGVCIVELASVIGGERFSDSPRCVDRVIGSFLRGWNDRTGYASRQRLLPYASRAVGTSGDRRASRRRRDICLIWSGADLDGGPLRRMGSRLRMRARIAWTVGLWPAIRLKEGAGTYAARVCFAYWGSERAFALLDRLLEVGAPPGEPAFTPAPEPALPRHWVPAELEHVASANGNGNGHSNGNGNGHHRDELGIRATIIARESGRVRPKRKTRS